jgi:hypothetical protein
MPLKLGKNSALDILSLRDLEKIGNSLRRRIDASESWQKF